MKESDSHLSTTQAALDEGSDEPADPAPAVSRRLAVQFYKMIFARFEEAS